MYFLLAGKLLLTIATLGYSAATIFADFNRTHATNPRWTGHARFHVVWQVFSLNALGLFALALIWWPGSLAIERLFLACLLALIVYAGFFAALLGMRAYGGAAYDSNGYLPFKLKWLGRTRKLDVNTTVFSVHSLLLLSAFVLILTGRAAAGN